MHNIGITTRRAVLAVGAVCSALVFIFVILNAWLAFVGPIGGVFIGALIGIGVTLSTRSRESMNADSGIGHKLTFIVINLYVVLIYYAHHSAVRSRPLIVYVAFGVIGVILSKQIMSDCRFDLVLLQIAIVAVATYYTSQIAYPAGAFNVDTKRLIPMIREVIASGGVDPSMFYSVTPLHQILIAILSQLTEAGVQEAYIFTSVVAMGFSVAIISTIRSAIPSLSSQEVLFAVLLYATTSFTLRRGLFPFKGNFFRPLILIAAIYSLKMVGDEVDARYFPVIGVCFLALVSGHQYSSGIATIIVMTFATYSVWYWYWPASDTKTAVRRLAVISILFFIILISYSIYATESPGIIKRIAGFLAALMEIGRAQGSTGGRFSKINFFVLLVSTVGQFLLYTLATLGIVVAVQRVRPQLDSLITWIGVAFGMLALSAFVNAFVIPTPRVHGLLAMLGLNITGGIGLVSLSEIRGKVGLTTTHIVVALFLMFSLASPVAGASLSVVDDQIPQYRNFQTLPEEEFDAWATTYVQEDLVSMEVPTSEVPVDIVDNGHPPIALTNTSKIPSGTIYQHNEIGAERGVRISNQPVLGGRSYAFLSFSPRSASDSKIYTNSEQRLYKKS